MESWTHFKTVKITSNIFAVQFKFELFWGVTKQGINLLETLRYLEFQILRKNVELNLATILE